MQINKDILKPEEKAVFTLRSLYAAYGYKQFKMSKFEEYDLYSKNKDFLVSDGVITFNDVGGKLLALKPDVTLSIIKNSKDEASECQKYYYNENVYRISETSHTYKEIMQTGLECIGDITDNEVFEVCELAAKSLEAIDESFSLHISDVALLEAILDEYSITEALRTDVINAITEKNGSLLKEILSESDFTALKCLVKSYESYTAALTELKSACRSDVSLGYINELSELCQRLENIGFGNRLVIDFSIINAGGYYSGIIFKGFIEGIGARVLSGGRYDKLMRRMNRKSGAVGFAVYLDTLERMPEAENDDNVNIALP